MKGAGLKEVSAAIFRPKASSQFIGEIRRMGLPWIIKGWGRLFKALFKDPKLREGLRKLTYAASDLRAGFNLFRYSGYGIYVGKK
ncbi:MAG: hypothetical protein QMD53_03240 [Actinomycetota bacterium]|nr:hypothetical protein [Actinomycetota bacterium]